MVKTMKIEGMMCRRCEAKVKKCLEDLARVGEAVVGHETDMVVVTLNGPVDNSVLKKTVEDRDYKVLDIR